MVTENQKKKFIKVTKIIGIITVCLFVLFQILFQILHYTMRDAQKTSEDFVSAAAAGDYKRAYSYLHPELITKLDYTEDVFIKHCQKIHCEKLTPVSWDSWEANGGGKRKLEGSFNFDNTRKARITMILKPVEGTNKIAITTFVWKIEDEVTVPE